MAKTAEELIGELENKFEKKVIAIVYNNIETGIQEGDEFCVSSALEREIKKQGIKNCVVLLSGSGGDFKTALLISHRVCDKCNKKNRKESTRRKKNGKIKVLKKPYTPEQAKRFLYED